MATTLPSSLRGILRKQESDNISLMDELNQTMKKEEEGEGEEKASKAEKLDKDEKQHSTTLIIGAKNWSSEEKRMYPPGSKGHSKLS